MQEPSPPFGVRRGLCCRFQMSGGSRREAFPARRNAGVAFWQDDFHFDGLNRLAKGLQQVSYAVLLKSYSRRPGTALDQQHRMRPVNAGKVHAPGQHARQLLLQLPIERGKTGGTCGQGKFVKNIRGSPRRAWFAVTFVAVERQGKTIRIKFMNIILVPSHKRPVQLDLSRWRTRWRVLGTTLLLVCALMVAGGAGALLLFSPTHGALVELQQLQGRVHSQKAQLAAVQADAQRQVNALAVQLGKLQAQSMRINALGQRLTRMGNLDDGEFDFDKTPAVGGREEPLTEASLLPGDIAADIQALGGQFDRQQEQLRVLQDMLLNHKVSSRQKPTGWPVDSGYISSYYGKRIDPFDGHAVFHRGIDFAAKKGTPVRAVAEGVVTYAGRRSGYGKVVEIDHGNGYTTRYAHNSKLLVQVGQRVRVDQEIAVVGSTGRSTGPHSHFEVWYQGHSVNPLAYVRRHRD